MYKITTKKRLIILLLFTFFYLSNSFLIAQKQDISLEDIFTKGTFAARGVQGFTSLNDGRYYCNLDSNQNLVRYEFATGKAIDVLVNHEDLKLNGADKAIEFSSFEFSEDETKILIPTMIESIYRNSYKAVYYVFDLTKKKLSKPVFEKIMHASFSPDASKIAYVKENNLFYYDLNRMQEVQITKDGKMNNIINGSTDWVYEEEFAIWKAFFWSPKGDKIAFFRFDESKVKEFEMAIYGSLYPSQTKFKYPKAGEANSIINIYVYDTKSELIAEMETGGETDVYYPRMQWTKDNNKLCIQRLNRLQNNLELLIADANSGKSSVIYTETNKYYVEITSNLYFLKDGKSFIISSERDGWNHLYHYDLSGKLIKQITKGNWDVDEFYGVDEKTKTLFYNCAETANSKKSFNASNQRYVYSIGLNGKNKAVISSAKAWNTAIFNSAFTYFLNVSSSLNNPTSYALFDSKGKQIRILEDNAKLKDKLKNYTISNAEFFDIKNSYNEELNAWIIKPSNFSADKKYPLLMYAYNGPGHQLAVDRWMGSNYFWYQMLAQKGYIIVCVDGRGTGFKGEEFKKCTYQQLGKFEIEDQIYVAKELGKLSYVDASRIGFWGWSFGGYMAGLAISKGTDVFKSAISVAPVTNWRYYDNIYTERYMRTPQENGESYDSNSPINHVEKIKGNYLIIHGTADDNVHFQNTVEMLDAMIKKGVKYDSEFYPNKNHGIGGSKTRLHLYERMTCFILEKL
jgi:dipeptidyl-peptidase-4